MKWGEDQADEQGLEMYLDGSEKGQPYYKKRHNFGSLEKGIYIPDRYEKKIHFVIDIADTFARQRPEYGSFKYRSLVRAPQKKA